MSKTTFFKRIALTAIAALGFGMLSVAPSQATVSGLTVTVVNGTSDSGQSDTTTAATFTVSGFVDSASDTITLQVIAFGARPDAVTSYTLGTPKWGLLETATSINGVINKTDLNDSGTAKAGYALTDSTTVPATLPWKLFSHTADKFVGAKFYLQLDSITALTQGTYNYQIVTKTYSHNGATQSIATRTDAIAIVVAAPAILSSTASTVTSTLGAISTSTKVATVSSTGAAAATLALSLKNAAGGNAAESITATITGPGTIGLAGGSVGKSVVLADADGQLTLSVFADGTAGVSTINVSSTNVIFASQTITFYAAAPSTIEAVTARPVIALGSGTSNADVIFAYAKDANGTVWGGTLYAYASSAADALIAGSETPFSCPFDSTNQRQECAITGKLKGTAKFKLIDAATVAAATVTSNEVSTRVSTGVAGSVVLSFDKATYAPGEKMQLRASVLDTEGLAMPAGTITSALTSAGITSSAAFGQGSSTAYDDDGDLVLQGATSAALNVNAGHETWVVYAPSTAGTVTVNATGSTGLAAAGRVAITASATVVDTSNDAAVDAASEAIDAANAATDAANLAAEAADAATVAAEEARDAADAATAAVEGLATEVATLMAALKAQITTLANTVAKIAKKVKA